MFLFWLHVSEVLLIYVQKSLDDGQLEPDSRTDPTEPPSLF